MKTVPLGEIAKFVRGVTYKPNQVMAPDSPEVVGVMRTKNVQRELDLSDVVYVPETLVGRQDQLIRSGDILISSANSWNLVGKCCWVPKLEQHYAIGGFITGLRVTSAEVEPRYLYRWIASPRVQAELRNTANQTTNIANLNLRRCEKLQFPLPPLAEQRRIAVILDQADDLRGSRGRVITRLDELAPAIFLDMFGQYSGDFMTVEEVAERQKGSIRTGPFGSQLLHSEFVVEGIAVLGLDNVVGNTFGWGERRYITPEKYKGLRRYTVRPGDVLVSIMGTCGRCVVVPQGVETAINTKHICAITVDTKLAVPEFVRAAFLWHPRSRQHLSQRTKGSIMDGLNMGIVKEMPLPLPPVAEQRQFVDRLRRVEQQQVACAESAASVDGLFESLQGRAFAGRL